MTKAVYIHIPFCISKCHYCDFNSYKVSGQPVIEYLQALDREMEKTVEQYPPDIIKSIFVGGGTPTVLNPKEMEILFKSINKHFPNRDNQIEFTVEANPGTVELEKLKVMKEYGVNRVSIGVQAFQDELLSYLGRIHTEKDIYHSIDNVRGAGFSNISIDLMFGLPNQNINMFKEGLTKAFTLEIPHFSVYSLKVEENTLFQSLYEKGTLPLPNEDEELQMYLMTIEEMEKNGYNHYEISNFARSEHESKHNLNYWKNGEYYGLGAGAHGHISNRRYENIKGVNLYLKKLLVDNSLPISDESPISLAVKKEDMLMLGLRMIEGVKFADYENAFKEDILNKFEQQISKLLQRGLLIVDNNGIKLSQKGLIYGNDVFAEFISL